MAAEAMPAATVRNLAVADARVAGYFAPGGGGGSPTGRARRICSVLIACVADGLPLPFFFERPVTRANHLPTPEVRRAIALGFFAGALAARFLGFGAAGFAAAAFATGFFGARFAAAALGFFATAAFFFAGTRRC